jgi:hypothetical protein
VLLFSYVLPHGHPVVPSVLPAPRGIGSASGSDTAASMPAMVAAHSHGRQQGVGGVILHRLAVGPVPGLGTCEAIIRRSVWSARHGTWWPRAAAGASPAHPPVSRPPPDCTNAWIRAAFWATSASCVGRCSRFLQGKAELLQSSPDLGPELWPEVKGAPQWARRAGSNAHLPIRDVHLRPIRCQVGRGDHANVDKVG